MTATDSLALVRKHVEESAVASGRDPDAVTIVVVTKARTVDEIRELYEAGHRDFGENRAQELTSKRPGLPRDIRWHFVGPLQSNKVRHVRPIVSLLHSMDRASLASAWVKGPGKPPPALLEINIGREHQKAGVAPESARNEAAVMIDLGVDLQGVMAIPPNVDEPSQYFEELVAIRDALASEWPQMKEVSAGMSQDYHLAVRAGATIVRPGRAIFDRH